MGAPRAFSRAKESPSWKVYIICIHSDSNVHQVQKLEVRSWNKRARNGARCRARPAHPARQHHGGRRCQACHSIYEKCAGQPWRRGCKRAVLFGLCLFTPPFSLLHAQDNHSHTEIMHAQELVALLAESYTGMAAACNLLTEWHAILGGQPAAAVSATAVGAVKDLFVSSFDANVADAQLRTVCRAL